MIVVVILDLTICLKVCVEEIGEAREGVFIYLGTLEILGEATLQIQFGLSYDVDAVHHCCI